MGERRRSLPGVRTLRLRLTLWYTAVLAVSIAVIGTLFYLGLQSALLDQVDQGIRETAVTEAETSVADFVGSGPGPEEMSDEALIRVLDAGGGVLGGAGAFDRAPAPLPQAGFATLDDPGEGARWRVYTEAVTLPDGASGWLQAGRSLAGTEAALSRLRGQLLLGLPLVLLLAGAGGLFLAGRALSPVDRMASAAEQISGSDLSRRMGPQGSEELDRLAGSFDRMLDRLDGAFRRERRFVSDVSHELRTPLTALRGRIEVTLSRPRATEEYVDTLRALEAEVARLTRLSEDLLLLARFDRQAAAPHLEEVDLGELLNAVAGQLRPLADARGASLAVEAHPGLALRADPDQLFRLCFNLVDNAVKFAGEGGHVRVTGARRDATVAITVSDDGPGIAAEHQAAVFDRFYRAEESRARSTGGHGLGLAIAAEIAHAHGGTLILESTPGRGASFTASLPA